MSECFLGITVSQEQEHLITFAASLSERRRYCGARRLCVCVSVCLSAETRLQALRISLRGEGHALYPVLSGYLRQVNEVNGGDTVFV